MKRRKELTAARARELLSYEPTTGVLRWRVNRGNVKAGSVAGSRQQCGHLFYRRVSIDGANYYAHRIIWLMVHGVFPKEEMDHIDHDGTNNKVTNLREATRLINSHNLSRQRNNTSSVTGVSWDPRRGSWLADIGAHGRQIHLGYFKNFNDAKAQRKHFERALGYHINHGRDSTPIESLDDIAWAMK